MGSGFLRRMADEPAPQKFNSLPRRTKGERPLTGVGGMADIWGKAAGLPCRPKCKHDLNPGIGISDGAGTSETHRPCIPCKAKVNKRRLSNGYPQNIDHRFD